MSILGTGFGQPTRTGKFVRPTKAAASKKTPWKDTVNGRLDALESPDRADNRYPALVRRDVQALEAAVTRTARSRIGIRLGTITADQAHVAYESYSPFTNSYDTGGDADEAIPATWGTYASYSPVHKNGYIFQVNAGKMMAWDLGTGVEVASTTDMTGQNPVQMLVTNDVRADRVVYEPLETEKLVKAEIVVAAAVTGDSTNYWTLTLRHRLVGQTSGELVGTARETTIAHGLAALAASELYNDTGIAMTTGEKLVLYVADTASPTPLEDLTLWLTIQREVR